MKGVINRSMYEWLLAHAAFKIIIVPNKLDEFAWAFFS
jgi:hypothetical protein